MKLTGFALLFAFLASNAQADLLSRWETSEEAIRAQVFVLHGNGSLNSDWSATDRRGKACLLQALQRSFGPATVEGYVTHLEGTAARRLTYGDPFELSVAWARAASLNRMSYTDVAPLALACNTSF